MKQVLVVKVKQLRAQQSHLRALQESITQMRTAASTTLPLRMAHR